MTIKEQKKLLIDLDLTQAEIARRLNVSRHAVNGVIHGRIKSKRISEYLKSLRLKKAA